MTDKKAKKDGLDLSNASLVGLIETLKGQAFDEIRWRRRCSPNHSSNRPFKETYADLLEALRVYVNQNPNFASKDISEPPDRTFHFVGEIVACATDIGIDTPDGCKNLVRKYDTAFPLDFLCEVEALRSAHPTVKFEVNRVDDENELPF